jgi:hypothetical protein
MASQKSVHRVAKREGPGSAGKLKPRKLVCTKYPKPCGKKYPKVRIRIPKVVRPNPEGFPDEKNGETRLNHAYKNGWIGKDFTPEITPEPGHPGF